MVVEAVEGAAVEAAVAVELVVVAEVYLVAVEVEEDIAVAAGEGTLRPCRVQALGHR